MPTHHTTIFSVHGAAAVATKPPAAFSQLKEEAGVNGWSVQEADFLIKARLKMFNSDRMILIKICWLLTYQ